MKNIKRLKRQNLNRNPKWRWELDYVSFSSKSFNKGQRKSSTILFKQKEIPLLHDKDMLVFNTQRV